MSRSKADLMRNRRALDRETSRTALFGTQEDREYLVLPLDQLHTSPDQPRRHFDCAALQGLASSIVECGVLQPILVRETARDQFQIIAGERRWRASQIAGKSDIPALVVKTEDPNLLAVLENLQREDLDAFETARALQLLVSKHQATHEELARLIGKSQSYVSRTLKILDLPAQIIKEYPDHRQIPATMLAEIAAVEHEDQQLALWERAKAGASVQTVRQAKRGQTLPAVVVLRVMKASARIAKDLALLREQGRELEQEQRVALERLRTEIDALLYT
jgi:ParB family transcriptional regulator, chromosome partitioning protein